MSWGIKFEVGEVVEYWSTGRLNETVKKNVIVTSTNTWDGWVEVFNGQVVRAVPQESLHKVS
jgi:hypothetical protein